MKAAIVKQAHGVKEFFRAATFVKFDGWLRRVRAGRTSAEFAPKGDCAACPQGAAAQPRIPKNRRSDPRGVGSNVCTRACCLFISRSVCQRWLTPGRHGLTSASLARPKTWCRSVFVLLAFPPPPVYVLDNESQPKLSGVRYPEADHFLCGRRRVFIRAARTSLPTHPAQAFRLRLGRQWQQLNRRLLSSSVALPRRLPIPSPVTAPLRTATGGGLYAGACDLSRVFLKKNSRRCSADFPPFRLIQKVHPQLISTGGNFMRGLSKRSRREFLDDEPKKSLPAARRLHSTICRGARSGARVEGDSCVMILFSL